MGKCPNCGRSAWFLRTIPCKTCGKTACDKCARYAFQLITPDSSVIDNWYVCSNSCMDILLGKFVESITPKDVPLEAPSMYDVVYRVLWSQKNTPWLSNYMSTLPPRFYVSFALDGTNSNLLSSEYLNPFLQGLIKHVRTTRARNLMTAGRFEDAAKVYESMQMYEEAGDARARKSEIKIRRTEVSVDLNSLLRELKDGGIVVVYRCPHCGGNLKIGKDANVESLKQCVHCGSKIETMDLASFIRTALS